MAQRYIEQIHVGEKKPIFIDLDVKHHVVNERCEGEFLGIQEKTTRWSENLNLNPMVEVTVLPWWNYNREGLQKSASKTKPHERYCKFVCR